MSFSLSNSIQILERTPNAIAALLDGLDESWTTCNEGTDSWSVFDIVGHLIHGEKDDWIQRMDIILSANQHKTFKPFDRFAQFEESKGKSLPQLLKEFANLRKQNVAILCAKNISEADLNKTGIHPALGQVTLKNLISTWVAHDLGHLAQIARVMAKQHANDVGPWKEYLRILK